MNLTELRKLAEAATPGPYYVALDEADECGPHRNSGLSLVDTGRQNDWPIARLCESASANLIAALSPERILALLDVIEASDILNGPYLYEARVEAREQWIAARKRLEGLL